jgi:serine/threonine protein phosphatase PrpC
MTEEPAFDLGAATHTGYERQENQDLQGIFDTPVGKLLVLADGMGGHLGGALAAKLTVQGLQQALGRADTGRPLQETIKEAFEQANAAVCQRAGDKDEDTRGMGSTALMLLLSGHNAWIAHVGDSRAYLLRSGRLTRLTKDHTRVQRMVDVGILTEEEARVHPDGNLLDRAMGQMVEVEADIACHELLPQDMMLLCSDGLWAYSTETEIEQVLNRPGSAQQLCDQLVGLALDKGGEDNVTVQLLRLTDVRVAAAASSRTTRERPELNDDRASSARRGRRHHKHVVIAAAVLLLGLFFWTHRQPLHPPEVGRPEAQQPTAPPKPQPSDVPQHPPDSAAVKNEVEEHATEGEKPLAAPEEQPSKPTQTPKMEDATDSTGEGAAQTDPAAETRANTSPGNRSVPPPSLTPLPNPLPLRERGFEEGD